MDEYIQNLIAQFHTSVVLTNPLQSVNTRYLKT